MIREANKWNSSELAGGVERIQDRGSMLTEPVLHTLPPCDDELDLLIRELLELHSPVEETSFGFTGEVG